jgi:ESCRT-I complex subunit VPS28
MSFVEKEKVALFKGQKQRGEYDNLSDLYSIIVTVEHLETAFVRDSITADEYTAACNKLIAQFKTMRAAVAEYCPDIRAFMRANDMNCTAAAQRLLVTGVPATVEHGGSSTVEIGADDKLTVFHAVQAFITTMDQLKLNMCAVDELHPNLSDLVEALNKVPNMPPEHVSRTSVRTWLVTLNSSRFLSFATVQSMSHFLSRCCLQQHRVLIQTSYTLDFYSCTSHFVAVRAHEELDGDQVRQMSFDLEVAYQKFEAFFKAH